MEVLTTCARDYITWRNEYPEGTDRIRGVTVRRFANDTTRDIAAFDRYSDWIFNNPHSRADEMEWLKQQGPWSPALTNYLQANHQRYDVLIFFTYLYATTVTGVEVNPARRVLVPTAHDEPAIRLEIYKDVFARPAAIMFNTEIERQFLKDSSTSCRLWRKPWVSAWTSRSTSRTRACRCPPSRTRPATRPARPPPATMKPPSASSLRT